MKKVFSVPVCFCAVFAFVVCTILSSCASSEAAELIKIGLTFGDMSNPVWADCANHMVKVGPDYGFEVSTVGAETSDQQITQIENFITAGNKAIVVGAKDTKSLGDYMASVLKQDIVVFALGYEISNYTADMMVQNYQVGYSTASMAAEWINKNFGDTGCEVLIVEAPEYDVLVERVDGMKAALAELAPKAKIVSFVAGTTTAQVLPQVENAFTANPKIKVCVAVGDGGSLACREAAMGMGLASDDFGIFGVDCTEEVATAIYNKELIRGALSLGGGAYHGETILGVLKKIFAGEDFDKNTFYPEMKVTKDNVETIAAQLNYKIK